MALVLVVDDDPMVLSTICRTLEAGGHRTVRAANGREGTAAFRHNRPDLVIADIIMPEQDGISMIMDIRDLAPDARIIATSGGGRLGPTDFLTMADKIGAMATLAKPFESAELIRLVRWCLGTRAASPGAAG